ncbi:alpha/beta hydrolase [bacterium]|nr:MAG: alpha/beta hydrolase [bacterium]
MPTTEHIVFIHGFADISKLWHRSRSFFETHGFIIHFYDYRTMENYLDIPMIVNGLIKFINENIGQSHYQIFAHSQGGLVAEWLDFFKSDQRLKRIITIGTPFQGNTLPLIAPKSILRHLPVGRKQIADLACMSSILSAIIRERIENRLDLTPYISLITHSSTIPKIQSDGIVSVCSGNRNAEYYVFKEDKIQYLPPTKPTVLTYVKSNHLPLTMVRLLQPAGRPNSFSALLLSAFNGEPIIPYDAFKPSQCVFVFPAKLKEVIQVVHDLQKINFRSAQNGNFLIVYYNVKGSEPFIKIGDQFLQLQPGKFTYLLDSSFLNTGT